MPRKVESTASRLTVQKLEVGGFGLSDTVKV